VAEVLTNTHSDASTITYEDLRANLLLDYQTNGYKSLRRDKNGHLCLDTTPRLDGFFQAVAPLRSTLH
jgi:hypothetical protein